MQYISRRDFITQMGGLTLIGCACSSLVGCSTGSEPVPAPPTGVDFNLDVSSGALSNNGGFLVNNGVIVGRTTAGTFIAVSANCTHQGTILQFDAAGNRFHCTAHGSNFNISGSVINGPATSALVKYNTELSGTTLRVFS